MSAPTIGAGGHRGSDRNRSNTPAEYMDRDELTLRKTRYAFEEPALRAAALRQTDEFVAEVAGALAHATGHDPGDLDIQVVASTLVAALVAAVRHWHTTGYQTPLREQLDHALTIVESGLRLRPPHPRAPGNRRTRTRRTVHTDTSERE